jgi:hypothetical protein
VIRGLKLLLDPDLETNYQPSLEAKRLLKSLGKTSGEVAAEYLKELVGHAKVILARRFGPAADEMDLSFVLGLFRVRVIRVIARKIQKLLLYSHQIRKLNGAPKDSCFML